MFCALLSLLAVGNGDGLLGVRYFRTMLGTRVKSSFLVFLHDASKVFRHTLSILRFYPHANKGVDNYLLFNLPFTSSAIVRAFKASLGAPVEVKLGALS